LLYSGWETEEKRWSQVLCSSSTNYNNANWGSAKRPAGRDHGIDSD